MKLSSAIFSAIFFRSQDPARPIVWCVIGICAGLYIFFNGFRLLKRRHLILNTPLSKIRSAPLGLVELSGLAAGPYTVTAPITNRSCYYFRTVVWEWKQSGKNKQWVKVAADCMHVPFFVDDNTGKVMVDPCGAELDLHLDFHQEFCDGFFTTKEEAPPNVRDFLGRHGINTTNKIKVEEYCIKPKNSLFLLGTLAENHSLQLAPKPIRDDENNTLTLNSALWFNPLHALSQPAMAIATGGEDDTHELSVSERLMGGSSRTSNSMFSNSAVDRAILEEEFSHAAATRAQATASASASDMSQQQKIVAALQKAGISNPSAWAAAGITGPGSLVNMASTVAGNSPTAGFEVHPPVVLMKGKNNPTFLISWRSQSVLARSFGWKCALMIWGGPALALLCLYGLLTLTHLL